MTSNTPAPRRSYARPLEVLLYASSPLATIVTAPLLARALGPAERGQYGVAMAVFAFALTLGLWGQAETYLSEARLGYLGHRPQTRISLVGSAITALLGIVALLILNIPPIIAIATMVWVGLVNQTALWRSVSIAHGDLAAPATNSIVFSILRIVAFSLAAATGTLSLVAALVLTQLITVLAGRITVGRATRHLRQLIPSRERAVSTVLRAGTGVIIFDLFNAVSLRSDLIILQLVSNAREVGIYAAPAALCTAALGITQGFKSRMQAHAIQHGDQHLVLHDLLKVLLLGALGASALIFAAPLVVTLLFGSEYSQSIAIIRLLAPATVALVVFDLGQGLLVVLGRRSDLIIIGATSAAVNLLSLVLLCPTLGATGAALASIIGYSLSAALAWAQIWRLSDRAP